VQDLFSVLGETAWKDSNASKDRVNMDYRKQRKREESSIALSVWENEGGGLGPSHPNYLIYLSVEAALREAASGKTARLNEKQSMPSPPGPRVD
jgi:hypothetical protein